MTNWLTQCRAKVLKKFLELFKNIFMASYVLEEWDSMREKKYISRHLICFHNSTNRMYYNHTFGNSLITHRMSHFRWDDNKTNRKRKDGQQLLTCMGDTATRLESDLDRDLESCRSNTLRGIDLILPRVQALSSYPAPVEPPLGTPPVWYSGMSPFWPQ